MKRLYSSKSCCIRVKVDVFVQSGCNLAKWLYSVKVVVFGQSGCFRAKVVEFGQKRLYSGKSGYVRAKWLHSGKSGCIHSKVLVFGQKWMYSGKWL